MRNLVILSAFSGAVLLSGCGSSAVSDGPSPRVQPAPVIVSETPIRVSEGSIPRMSPSLPQSVQDDVMDAIISVDARSWLINQYRDGTAQNTRITRSSGSGFTARTEFFYTGGTKSWARVDFSSAGEIECIEFEDFDGACRPIGDNPAHGIAAAAVLTTAAVVVTSGSNTPSSSQPSECNLSPVPAPEGGLMPHPGC